jgi:hypothetical protein
MLRLLIEEIDLSTQIGTRHQEVWPIAGIVQRAVEQLKVEFENRGQRVSFKVVKVPELENTRSASRQEDPEIPVENDYKKYLGWN